MSYDHVKILNVSELHNFSVTLAENLDSNLVLQHLLLSLSATQKNMIDEWSRFSQIHLFLNYFPRRINLVFFLAKYMSSTCANKNHLSHDAQIHGPNQEIFFNRAPKFLSQIAIPTTILPKDDKRNFVQEQRLGLPKWTMIKAIRLVVEDVSKYLDIPIFELSTISEHLPFQLEWKHELRALLLLHNEIASKWCPWLLRPSNVIMNLVLWILQKNLNHPLIYHLEIQISTCIFRLFLLQFTFSKWQTPPMMRYVFSQPFFLALLITSN